MKDKYTLKALSFTHASKPSGTSPSFFWSYTLTQRMKWSSSSSSSSLSNSSSSTLASTAPPHLVDVSLAIATRSKSHPSTRLANLVVDSSAKKNQHQQLSITPRASHDSGCSWGSTTTRSCFLTQTRRGRFTEVD